MLFYNVLNWLKNEFGYAVPEDYKNFLMVGDFISTWRKYYVIDNENKEILEISDWYNYDNISLAYINCLDEEIIEKYHLPIFDSCGITVVIDCNIENDSYGYVFARETEGYYDIEQNKNIYNEFALVAKSFSEIINNLKTREQLEALGVL